MAPGRPRALLDYEKKRDFRRTSEPRGRAPQKTGGRLFVVQKHAARRLHFDFRLELDGALKSWAVPKGPSANPADRRLAVHVEDHPVDYGSFEGVIPAPGYGAGTVMLWDRGEWEPVGDPAAGYRDGKLKFILRGRRLRGRWMLVRMKDRDGEGKENWLLAKEKGDVGTAGDPVQDFQDSVSTGRTMEQIAAGARPPKDAAPEKGAASPPPSSLLRRARRSAFPRVFSPQLATLVERAPAGPGWIHEVKFDGYRILCFLERGKARLMSRNGLDWTGRFPSVARATEKLKVGNAIIDGEVVVQRKDGTTDFQLLQNHLRGDGKAPLTYMVFDLPYAEGSDLTPLPLAERKAALKEVLSASGKDVSGVIRFSDHLEGRGGEVFRSACSHALEGIISKRADAPYVQRRSADWVKVKCLKEQEFVIGGFTVPKGSRAHFGSLLIGTYDADGKLTYNGHVGTGFSEESLVRLHRALEARRRDDSPFSRPVEDKLRRVVRWVDPVLVCQVGFIGWTEEGHCRHPSFMGLREDKKPREVHVEKPLAAVPAGEEPPRAGGKKPSRDGAGASVAGVRLTHPDKVLYRERNVTKLDLARYYETVAPWILPHLVGRPVTLVRCPDGREAQCFYQKHPADAPVELRRIPIQEKEKKGDYLLIDDARGLAALAQMGALEIHVWGSTEKDLERPDRLVFDLDPAPDVPWTKTVLAARRLKERLEAIGLRSFVKTTGGKGLHVVAPVVPDLGWEAVKAFTKAMADAMAESHPGDYVAKASKVLRPGKVFIDYLRNGRGATSVCPYSTRASAEATVAAPLRWEELSGGAPPGPFTLSSVPGRLAKLKEDPWKGFFSLKQGLPADVRKSLAAPRR